MRESSGGGGRGMHLYIRSHVAILWSGFNRRAVNRGEGWGGEWRLRLLVPVAKQRRLSVT